VMFELFTKKVIQGSLKCASNWQSVLHFGLPMVVIFRGTDYLMFRELSRSPADYELAHRRR
jgi:hypothetical protein